MSTNTVSSHAEASSARLEPSPLSDSGQHATPLCESALSRRAILRGAPTVAALAVAATLPGVALAAVDPSIIDWPAAKARFEGILDVLRTCYVADGFHSNFDHDAGQRALVYLQRKVASPEDDEIDDSEDFTVFLDFMHRYGQALDWVFSGDPGGMIAAGAARSWEAMGGANV